MCADVASALVFWEGACRSGCDFAWSWRNSERRARRFMGNGPSGGGPLERV